MLIKQILLCMLAAVPAITYSQVEWRLVLNSYSTEDPDGLGPAAGSVQFTLEMHTTSGTVNAREISVGYAYQSARAMVPTTPGCANATNPANITISAPFVAGGYTYNVSQCNVLAVVSGGQAFDRVATGLLDQGASGAGITLTTTWVPAFTVTLWSLSPVTSPEAGYALLQSSASGSPGANSNYAIADDGGNEVAANSLTYNTPLALCNCPLPVGLSAFDITCNGNGARLQWQTVFEQNSKAFEVEKSTNGINGWEVIGALNAAGAATTPSRYQFIDLQAGNAYYRLRQTDRDGQFTYSSIQRAGCITRNSNLLVYPVPVRNLLNIVIHSARNSKATIVLTSVTGSVVRTFKTDLQRGTNNLHMQLGSLPNGEYFLKVLGDEVLPTQKITVLR